VNPPEAIPSGGLTAAEAERRADRGLANVDTSKQRTDADVIRSNVVTFFNVVLASLIIALAAVGEIQDCFFVGIVVVLNVAVSTFQELRATRTLRELVALTAPEAVVIRDGVEVTVRANEVVQGDLVHLKKGDQVVVDGHIVARTAEIDESLLTGESDSVKRTVGDELRSGSFCTAGDCFYAAERVGNEAYAVKLAADARELVKRSSPLQIQFNRILRLLLTATAVLAALLLISYNLEDRGVAEAIKATTATVTTVVPTGLLLGMTVVFAVGAVRVSKWGAIVQDINAVEALNYVDIICLDKTGTITANKLTLDSVHWAAGMEVFGPWLAAFVAAAASESKTTEALADAMARHANGAQPDGNVPFNSERRWSAMRLRLGGEARSFILGAPETVLPLADGDAGFTPIYAGASDRGLRGVVFAEAPSLPQDGVPVRGVRPLALITLADVLRPEVREAFAMMDSLGIEPKLISGDNPKTVLALIAQLGISLRGGGISGAELEGLDDQSFSEAVANNSVFGRITPALKARIVATLRSQSHFVAMCGDGANDVQALRAADVAVAMASGTSTARAVAGIVLLNDSFAALIRGVKEATAVLGNTARLSKLFLAKSMYAYLLIIATNMLGLDFPFLPRQGSVTALLTLGIPAVFISISVPPPDSGRDFTRNVIRWALPASLSLAISAIIVHLFVEGLLGRNIEEARTLVSLVLGITGVFYVLEVLGFEGASWRSLTRPVLTTVLAATLIFGMFLTVYTPWIREFFDFTQVHAFDWTVVGIAVTCSLAGQYLLSNYYHEIIDFLVARPGKKDALRGRAA
jgi:cation-transporting ATPase E